MSLWEIYKAKRLGYADDLWTSLIGHQLGGYSWLSDYETTPYLYRAMPNLSHYYNREIMEEVVGGSVGWNQLCNDSSVTVQSGHKYFLKKGSATSIGASSGSAITGLTSGSDIVVDLTLALGSTIADYVYSLEQATAGSGVAWLKENFPRMCQYNPYDAGSIQSVSGLVSHDTVGFNQWDEEWESGIISSSTGADVPDATHIRSKGYNRCFPNTAYYVRIPTPQTIRMYWYDADKNFISAPTASGATVYTTPQNCHYFRFVVWDASYGTTYNHDICINLSDASRNGQYEPYRKSSYPLDSTLTLRGIPKLDNGKLYYDGDVYESDGTVTRRYGIVDLGTLTWTDQSESGNYSYYSNVLSDGKKPADNTDVPNCKCAKYVTTDSYGFVANKPDKSITTSTSGRINVKDNSYTTVEAFKSAMNGVMLVYELATPTTETAQPFTKTQLCDSGGTEEFITSGIVSVGHKSKYAEK